MDVERIQKINKLALDLMKQGLASDRDDAVVQAEKIFKSNDGDNQSIRERMHQGMEPRVPAAAANSVHVQPDDLHPDKVKDILQQNSQFLVKKITEFQEQMTAMRKEVEEVKRRFSQTPAMSGAAPKLGEIFTPAQEKPKEQPQQNTSSHPRSGNYKTEEVSIEKFFYMGNKK
ncbi:MAG: hypothetical protein AABX64_02525 [Nanoarchaeota archaeon]